MDHFKITDFMRCYGPAKDVPNLSEEVKKRLDADQNSAIEWINSLGTSKEVCEIYDKAVRNLYWLEKSANGLVVIGRAGIDFCLQESEKHQATNPKLAEDLKAQAKTIAYNVAANTWPGWGDDGVTIAPNDSDNANGYIGQLETAKRIFVN